MIPLDDLLKMVTKYNADQAAKPVAKQAIGNVVNNVLPAVAKEATESVNFVKSLPVETLSDDVMTKIRRVQSGADAQHLLAEHQKNFAHIAANQQQSEARLLELRDTYGFEPQVLDALARNEAVGEQVTSAGLDLASKAIDETRHWAGELLKGTPDAAQQMLRSFDSASSFMRQSAGFGSGRSFRLLSAGPQGGLEALKEAAGRDTLLAAKMQTTGSLDDFARIIHGMDNKGLMKMANRMQDASWNGAVRELYFSNMLSRVKTQTKNIYSGTKNILVNMGERYINAGVSSNWGTGSHIVTTSDANNLVKGYWHGFREALGKWGPAYQGKMDARWADKSYLDDPRGGEMEQILQHRFGKVGALTGKYLRTPTSLLQASDTFFKEWTYYAELYAESAKRAAASGENFEEVFQKFYYDPPTELTEAARARAVNQGLVLTHTEDLWNKWDNTGGTQAFQRIGYLADALNRTKSDNWLLTVTMPFVKTSANALRFNLERFPGLNMASSHFRADMSGANGQAARELAITKSIMGGTVMGGFAILAANGEITGAAPRDPELRAAFLAVHPEYAINFFGMGWSTYDPSSTLGILLSTAANVGSAVGSRMDWGSETGVQFDSMIEALCWAASLAFTKINDTTPMMEPVGTLMDMMGNGDYPTDENLQNPILRGLFKYANQWVPGLYQDAALLLDPVQKDLSNINDYLLQYVPGHGEEANLDAFGRKRMLGHGFHNGIVPNTIRFMSGFNVRPENLSKVDQELLRLGVQVRERKKIRGVPLSTGQANELLRRAGPQAYADVEEFIESDMYKELSDKGRGEIIKRLIYAQYDIASGGMINDDQGLLDKVLETGLSERTIVP